MKELLENILAFVYSLSMGDYFFFIGTFLLIVLFIYVIYLIKLSDIENKEEPVSKGDIIDDIAGELDLAAITKAIETEYKPEAIKLTSFEIEQESNAIISYEELVKNKDKLGYDYDDEYTYDAPDLTVKKINLTTEGTTHVEPKLDVKLMHYDKEEAFLKALKELQENLGH